MRILFSVVFVWAFFVANCMCTVPILLYSHKLVPKIQSYVNNYNHLVFPEERAKEVARKLIEPCSADAYVLVNQPNLTLDDLQDFAGYTFLRTYSLMSSTLGAIPRAQKPLDLDKLESLAVSKCSALPIHLTGLEEVDTYIDTGKRVIRIDLPELPEGKEERRAALKENDEAVRRTLRKLPSPHHALIYTTTEKRLLNKNHERRWSVMDIFPDISKDPSRTEEFERNNNVVEEEHPFPQKRTNLINKKLYEGSTLLDPELIEDNELLILGILLITAVLILYQVISLLVYLLKRVFGGSKPQKKLQSNSKKVRSKPKAE